MDLKQVLVDDEHDIHCENLIGAVTIPVGVAGPVHVHGEHLLGEHTVPLATTEGALVASVNRGAKATTQAGGVTVMSKKVGITRGPVFYTGSLKKTAEHLRRLEEEQETIKKLAESTSTHLKYLGYHAQSSGPHLFVRFQFDSDQAMGMNMATIATQKIVELIESWGARCLAVAGNYDVDKKPAWMNMLLGRGYQVWAEVVLPEQVVREVLKTTAAALIETWQAKCLIGSAMSGALGFNAHYANIVAAVYAATGQDLAHVVEGSHGITEMEARENGSIYISVYLPAILVGTVGGGTKLKTQTACRAIAGVTKAEELAELVGAAVLCGELSLLAALSAGTLAQAHQKLGR